MYAYTNTGAPTFYVGAAPMTANNTASVALLEPEGGTCLGCVPTSGRQRANKGTAFFEFTSSTTGFVTLPGESRKAFFKGPVTWPAAPDGLYGLWVWTRVATSVSTAFADYTVLTTKLSPSSGGNGIAVSSDGRYGCELQTSGAAAGYVLCIAITSTGSTRFIALVKWHGNEMDGAWQYSSSSTTTDVFTAKRLVDGNGNYETVKSAMVASDPAMLRAVFEEHPRRLAARAE
ncbi:MAG: hypothetical protein EAZ24_02245 [Burkholderiales bacterium]|nr:MAG: hypothetical protein EAZ21_09435 [Betaproteobacteria bacterium]TAG84006.1 MAG: hypothetical protein EAZ24_02245 [Burkholderiales bacterium]